MSSPPLFFQNRLENELKSIRETNQELETQLHARTEEQNVMHEHLEKQLSQTLENQAKIRMELDFSQQHSNQLEKSYNDLEMKFKEMKMKEAADKDAIFLAEEQLDKYKAMVEQMDQEHESMSEMLTKLASIRRDFEKAFSLQNEKQPYSEKVASDEINEELHRTDKNMTIPVTKTFDQGFHHGQLVFEVQQLQKAATVAAVAAKKLSAAEEKNQLLIQKNDAFEVSI